MKGSPRTALIVVVAALALMLAAGTGATASLLITGKQVKDGSLTSRDIKNRSLKVKDLSHLATAKLKGATGPAGPRGATGPAGPAGTSGLPGLPGLPGLSGFEVVTKTLPVPITLPGTQAPSVTATCASGKKALSATASYAAPVANLLSQVTRTADNAFSATGVNLAGVTGQTLTLDVVCATIPS